MALNAGPHRDFPHDSPRSGGGLGRPIVLASALLLLVGALAAMQLTDEASASSQTRRVARCTVPTPRNWEQENVLGAYEIACDLGGWICLPDPLEWWAVQPEGYSTSKIYQSQKWQTALVRQHKGRVFIQLDPYRPPRKGPLASRLPAQLENMTFASPAVRAAFKEEAIARTRWFDAKYVCLAMEIDAYYEQQRGDFDNFVTLFAETREAIKRDRPDAVVFVSFQYEQLLGGFAKVTGAPGHEPQWELFEKFEPFQDAVGISSYPQLGGIKDPTKLPDNYYSRIAEHTRKPIVFTELGWSTNRKWGGSEASQAEFLRRFEKVTRSLDLALVNHFMLHDTKVFGEFFESMGLLDSSGKPRQAHAVWKSLWPEK